MFHATLSPVQFIFVAFEFNTSTLVVQAYHRQVWNEHEKFSDTPITTKKQIQLEWNSQLILTRNMTNAFSTQQFTIMIKY